jgi:hypothetical protein
MKTKLLFAYLLISISLFGVVCSVNAATEPVDYIPASNRVDMVEDTVNDTLYISSTDGKLLRYSLKDHSMLTPINLGGCPYGIDISPDEKNIVIANETANYSNATSNLNVLNIASGAVQTFTFSIDKSSYEGGTASVAFATNDTFLVTSNGATWNPMRKVNFVTGTSSVIGIVSASGFVTELSASADHSVIGIAEQCIMPYGPERYRVSDGNWLSGTALSGGITAIAANRNGQQYMVTQQMVTYICDNNLNFVKQIHGTYSDEHVLGIVYSPTSDVGYISWVNSDGTHSEIQAFDTNSWNQIATVDAAPHFTLSRWDNSYRSGRLRMSSDGSLLFATVNGGVNVYSVPEPSTFALLGMSALGGLL